MHNQQIGAALWGPGAYAANIVLLTESQGFFFFTKIYKETYIAKGIHDVLLVKHAGLSSLSYKGLKAMQTSKLPTLCSGPLYFI